jgi:hypothetical protein
MARISPVSIGYIGLAFMAGALSPFVPGLLGFMLFAIVCGLLFKACFNLLRTAQALWNGRLLSETDYTPIDRKYALVWPIGLGCAAVVLAKLPIVAAGAILDLTIAGEIIFIAGNLLGRSLLLRRFKSVRTARNTQLSEL